MVDPRSSLMPQMMATPVNVLKREKKQAVVSMLCEGMSIRAITRVTGVHKVTIMRLLVSVGEHCERILDERMRDLSLESIQVDELWCYVGCKEAHLRPDHPAEFGDQYCFIAMDEATKLIPSWLLGKRNDTTTCDFIADLACRVRGRIHLSTDGWPAYPGAVASYFAGRADYGVLVKSYGSSEEERRYSPPRIVSTHWISVQGFPTNKKLCTSHIERQNLTVRMQQRRFTRLTNAFSKKWANLKAALAMHFGWYNFCRVHQTINCTPAMAAGVTGSIWTIDQLIP